VNIAVTGATGFVGRHTVRALVRAGHRVTAVVRHQTAELPFDKAVMTAAGNVDDPKGLTAAFAEVDCVVHLVGIIAETRKLTFEKTVVRGTANVVDACRQARVGRLVYLSAMGTGAEAPSRYHQSKYAAEQAVVQSGLEYVILRPSVIFGPGDGFVSMLENMIRRSPVTPVIGDGRYRLQPIHIDDVTAAIVRSCEMVEAVGETIDLGGPEKLEYIEILNILKSVLNKRRRNLFLPVWLMRFGAGLMETVIKPAPLTRDQLTMMQMGNTGDNGRMKKLFGIEPISLKEGLQAYMG